MKAIRYAAVLIGLAVPAHAAVDIQTVTSPGGITAWLVEDHNIPFTALEIRFKGGPLLDADDAQGAANMMTALLEEGAGDRDASAFAAARDDLAARFGFSSDSDTISVSAQMLTENRDEAAGLLRDALTEPRFDADAVERVRGQILSNIRSDAQDPGAIAMHTMQREAFATHPYARDSSGTLDDVKSLTRDDLEAARQSMMTRDHLYVAAAGDIDPEALGALLDRVLGDLPATGAALPPEAEWKTDGSTTVVDFPTPQSVVRFGQPGIDLHDPDFFAAYVLNEIMGGSRFSARLMDELRAKRGLTYGAYSYLCTMERANFLLGQFASDNDKVAEAVDVTRDIWRRTAENGVTKDELDAAKTYLTGAYPLRWDGNGPIASILVGMQMQGFPADYPRTRNDRIDAVTLADVNRVAARLLQPDNLHFVVVGQPDGMTTD
ncbi:M16 family metallopeptidase [Falsirhodobacter algicola]|uniref:Insulinase family protein n=1 Tax=Falsirhodobacter algicola TaxID=2692330 RepID=A0A8J8MT65_9RHOB|nr:pitrilysin family protein [Falsirhodobacter algicola]QUS36004.1 insulinase family protein [Falsirhodobacter algicola]